MKNFENEHLEPVKDGTPFPAEWLKSNPGNVAEILNKLSLEDQARCAMQMAGRDKQSLLLLSEKGKEVAQILPPEEIYFMAKEIGLDDSLPVLSVASCEQLQYIFDLEWWQGDRFMPERALEWLIRLEKNNDIGILEWLVNEDFDQIVMVLQSLIKVFKNDDMTNSYTGVENLKHFTPDGVYDVFFKVPPAENLLKRFLKILYDRESSYFQALMEAIIWSPVTSTVEKAYRWRLTRTSARGIPEFEEALEIYSRLDPGALSTTAPTPEDFVGEESFVAPHHVMAQVNPSSFFALCLSLLKDTVRIEAIRWELVCLANKIMVADRFDPGDMECRKVSMQKILSSITIGLELGSGSDIQGGVQLLQNTWMQTLFQVGYGRLISLKWAAEKISDEQKDFLGLLLREGEIERLLALQKGRFSKWVPSIVDPEQSREFESLAEIDEAKIFLLQCGFYSRFARKVLDLIPSKLEAFLESCRVPDSSEEISIISLTSTALARCVLFKEITCLPLSESAAKSFLEMIFVSSFEKDVPKICDEDLIVKFKTYLLEKPMAWTKQDKVILNDLLRLCEENLREHFGRIDLKRPIKWEFTQGLCIAHQ